MDETTARIRLTSHDGARYAAYLELADHPHELVAGIAARSVLISSLIEGYDGPMLNLDFDKYGRAIGIEIVYSEDDTDEAMT